MKPPEILQCLLELCSGSLVWSPTKPWVLLWANTGEYLPKAHYAQERSPKVLGAKISYSAGLRDFPWEVSLGISRRWDKPQGTSRHLNKLLYWIQLWWQLPCHVATEGNIVLFFWWANSFEVSKMIPLLSKAGLRQNCQVRNVLCSSLPCLPTPTPPPPSSQEPSPPTTYPALSGISLGYQWLSFPSPLGIHLSWAHFPSKCCSILMISLMPQDSFIKL